MNRDLGRGQRLRKRKDRDPERGPLRSNESGTQIQREGDKDPERGEIGRDPEREGAGGKANRDREG